MVEQYLGMLENSLKEKKTILRELIQLSEKQREIVINENVEWDAFDKIVDEKGSLIEKLDTLDSGFDSVFGRIKEEIGVNKNIYKDSIQRIQKLITEVTDESTSLMAIEERNREQITNGFKEAKQKLNQGMVSNRVANNYYKAMSRVNFIDPQLMDKKK